MNQWLPNLLTHLWVFTNGYDNDVNDESDQYLEEN